MKYHDHIIGEEVEREGVAPGKEDELRECAVKKRTSAESISILPYRAICETIHPVTSGMPVASEIPVVIVESVRSVYIMNSSEIIIVVLVVDIRKY